MLCIALVILSLIHISSNDKGLRIARINHILAEDSPELNNDPSNENERDYSNNDIERYRTDLLWPEQIVRW